MLQVENQYTYTFLYVLFFSISEFSVVSVNATVKLL